MYRIRSISVDPKHWSMHWKLLSWSALKRRDVSMTTTKCGRQRLHKTMMQANEMRMRRDKTQSRENLAFINITHSFIIYYCVLLSVRSDTFLNTLGNQRSLRAARVHPAHTRRKKTDCNVLNVKREEREMPKTLTNDDQCSTFESTRWEIGLKLSFSLFLLLCSLENSRLCIFSFKYRRNIWYHEPAKILISDQKWAVRATKKNIRAASRQLISTWAVHIRTQRAI